MDKLDFTCCIVGCSDRKLTYPAPAEHLYTGNLFRASMQYAKTNADVWYIASSQHHLLEPQQVVEPYNLFLGDLSPAEQRRWAELFNRELMHRLDLWVEQKGWDEATFSIELHTTKTYWSVLAPVLQTWTQVHIFCPDLGYVQKLGVYKRIREHRL